MGAIYYLYNHTKNIMVSYYWKNDEFCDIHVVMHRYCWKYSDVIISIGGCDYYLFRHNETTNTMKSIRKNINTLDLYDSSNATNLEFGGNTNHFNQVAITDTITNTKTDTKTDTKTYTLNDISDESGDSEDSDIDSDSGDIDMSNHVPIWNLANCCEVCHYQFNVNDIDSDTK